MAGGVVVFFCLFMSTAEDIHTSHAGQSSLRSTVTVIVPVYKGGELFKRCLASLLELVPSPLEVLVVADGDPDGSGDYAEARGVRVVRLNGPSGPAKARNAGARHANGTLLFFVDADVTVPFDTIGRIQELFREQAYPSAVIGSYDDTPADTQFVSQYRNLLHHYVHQQGSEQAWTFWGACGAIRTTVFRAVGGFDERYGRPCIEDIELGYRLRRAGYSVHLCKSLTVKHLKRWTLTGMIRTDVFDRALPWTELILTHRDLPNDLNLSVSARWSGLLVLLFGASVLLLPWKPILGGISMCVTACGVVALNADLYRFYWTQRGILFALRALPLHALYYAYSSIAFAAGAARHAVCRRLGLRTAKRPDSDSSNRFQPEGHE